MGKWKNFSTKCGTMVLSVSMLATSILPSSYCVYAAETNDQAYEATEECARKIVTHYGNQERNWNISWSDEFNNDSLDNSKWSYMVGTGSNYSGDGWGNNEQQYYTDGDNTSFVTEDGAKCLKITAKKESKGGKNYTSARLWTMDDSKNPGGDKVTKFSKTYGRIESRIKINNQQDNMAGIWPAFWMMPANDEYGTWAASGELDIMEARGSNKNSVDGTIHYGSQWPNNKSIGGSLNKNTAIAGSELPDFSYADWHTYAVEWLPGEICWYVDDTLYYKTSNWYSTTETNGSDFTYPAPFDQDFYILLNLAIGGNYDGGALDDRLTEASMLVDYVRVYDLADADGNLIEYDESNVRKPVESADDHLVSGEVNTTNYVDSALAETKKTTGYPNENDRTSWFVSELEGGKADVNYSDDNGLTVNVTAGGNQTYSVQLIHNVPLTKGYRYVMEFDAKADASKTLVAKFGNIGGYPAYSNAYDIDLTTDWQHYKYVFDMESSTDADGRIEFNFQQSTGKCYFKNFSIISTGVTPEIDMDSTKEPLSNGNHIYNGTFDQGEGRLGFWHVDNASASVQKTERKLNVIGQNEEACVYQRGIKLLQSDSYKLTFDAKAEADASVKVLVENMDSRVIYAEKTLSLTSTEDEHEISFTMPNNVNDDNAVVKFLIGKNKITFDNISLIRTTNNNIDWDNIELYPMTNGFFFDGENGWNIWSEGDAGLSKQVIAGRLSGEINIPTVGNFWRVGMQSAKVKCSAGIPYKINIKMNLDTDKTIKIETPDGEQKDYQFQKGENNQVIEFIPNKNCSGNITLYWGVETGVVHFNIDCIDIAVDDSKITIPDGQKRPAEIKSAEPVKAGNKFKIEANDSEWIKAITNAYVNGNKVELNKIEKDGTAVWIDGAFVPDEGSYSVKFEATGYADTKTITQKVLPTSGNVLVNGEFTDNLNGWTIWHHDGATGSTTWENGMAVNEIISSQGAVWDNQLKQENMSMEASDYYLLSFDAYADMDRPIQMEFSNLGTASSTVINLTTSKQHYYIVLSNVPSSPNNYLLFMMGDGNGYSFSKKHKIYIDNVVLKKATEEEVLASAAPTMNVKSLAKVGQNLTFGYSDNETWASKKLSVTLDGNVVDDKYVLKDTSKNLITIAADAITSAGRHVWGFTAEGYSKVEVPVNILERDTNSLLAGLEWSVGTYDGDKGNIVYENNAVQVDFVETLTSQWNGAEFWSIQARSDTFTTLKDTKYALCFDYELIWREASTQSRDIMIEYLENGTGKQQTVSLAEGKHSVSYIFMPGESSANYILMMLGGTEFGVAAHSLKISNVKLCALDNDAQIPNVRMQPSGKTYKAGSSVEALKIDAFVDDGGVLTYQWFKNETNSLIGATEISGATAASYMPIITDIGTTYYFCIVTNTNNEVSGTKVTTVTSDIAMIKVVSKSAETGSSESETQKPSNPSQDATKPADSVSPKDDTSSADADHKPAGTITGVKNSYTVKTGSKSFTIKAEGYGDITFASSNNKVASIDPKTGKVKVKGPGIVKITIKASGDDTHAAETKVITIKVAPKKAMVKSAKSKDARQLTIRWKRDAQVSGYEIQYSTSKNFKNAKSVTVGKNKTTSKSIDNLKSGKKYYIRIRSYKTVGKTKLNGSWSKTDIATTK